MLRGKRTGCKFRRQHAISGYIVDFVCIEAKIIIETDGGIHEEEGQAEYDGGRTFNLAQLGYQLLRVSNQLILADPQKVINTINQVLRTLKEEAPRPPGSPLFWRGDRGRGAPPELRTRRCLFTACPFR